MAALFGISAAAGAQTQDAAADPLDNANVVWNSPSKDHTGSMPIGNGDVGMNVWVEPNGDLLLLLSKTDAWSEKGELLKLGRVRVSFSPNPLKGAAPFEQTLRLRPGEILIRAGAPGNEIAVRLWVDANRPVIRLEAHSTAAFEAKAELELWRTGKRTGPPRPICSHPDTVLENRPDRIVWHHRNETSVWTDNLTFQGLGDFIPRSSDPLLHRTFGGCIEGKGLVGEDSTTLRSAEARKRFVLSVHVFCDRTETADAWEEGLDCLVAENNTVALDAAREAHRAWWEAFWNRSWIRITGSEQAETVSRAYALQRWINACGGRGRAAIKFNGSIFSVGQDDIRRGRIGVDDPDYRRWGGRYWWQNTRLPYWPMLACGDYDLMLPLFDMVKAMIPLLKHRTNVWFDHDGAFINETVYFWGMLRNYDYGVAYDERLEKGLPTGELIGRGAQFIRLEYTASPELMAMMLDYYDHTRDENFLRETLLPMCDALLTFWDEHYETDDAGHMILYPAQALETYWDAENPAPDVAGLKCVLARLLDLPETATGAARKRFWKKLSAKVPPLPMEEKDGKERLAAAKEIHGETRNAENPELYAVFPFRLYGVGKPDLEMARHTFETRRVKGHWGWVQCDVQAAYLGLTKTAANGVAYRARTKDEASRFPAFWGPNADWIPDQCHGGNMMMGLEAMLMQADGDRILLMPAWPTDWDVDFKLHAPAGTVVRGTVKDGKIVSVTTDPVGRAKDIATP